MRGYGDCHDRYWRRHRRRGALGSAPAPAWPGRLGWTAAATDVGTASSATDVGTAPSTATRLYSLPSLLTG
jgi:hypothetical protein